MRSLVVILLLAAAASGESPVHHDLRVRVTPEAHALDVTDTIAGATGRFRLHANLAVESVDPAFTVTPLGEVDGGAVPLREYELVGPADGKARLRLTGEIHHPLVSEEQEYARSFSRTPGIVSDEGVVLSGASAWIPAFGDRMLTFRLEVELPAGWTAVSQGSRTGPNAWACAHPMEEVYLIAARFTEYSRPAANATAYAFLRRPDPGLAARFLGTTAQYLEMYRKLIGPYPFGKFALVENFWETGYGMPSFTLLGPQIIRFPFILHSSYPHEILHNWWGNSVYVDWETGNWCEGLTAYLADHLIKEGQGRGAEYRRDALKKYRNYVRGEKDFPLRDFRSRHSSATEAVGYGKSLMLFHMLRGKLGDEAFARGLQQFYRRYKFQRASFGDLAAVFGEPDFFRQWVERTGAPRLAVEAADGELVVRQTQPGEPYDLLVPVAITVAGEPEARVERLALSGREARLPLPAGFTRVDVDPDYDVFRLLDRDEIPPTLGEVFGAERVTIVPPAGEDWSALAAAWAKEGQVEVVAEDALEALPADRAVWILGRRNRFAGDRFAPEEIEVGAARLPWDGHSFVFTGRHPANPELAVGWIATDVPTAIPGLARKLPHYGKYSYLAFHGDEPANVAKGQWSAQDSPLVVHGEREAAARPAREPLARLAPVFDRDRLLAHVRFLADDRLKGRGLGTPELDEAADYIAAALKEAGLAVDVQAWEEEGKPIRNVIGVLAGRDPKAAPVVLGAHYDHLGLGWPDVRKGNEGKIHNGADDNASGVAVLLELAHVLAGHTPRRPVVFVAFSGEEWGRKGSIRFVRSRPEKAFAMVNLDGVGRLGGAKLQMLGSGTASEWKHIAMGVGYTTGVEAVCIPQDPGGSDQVSFHEAGVPAVQIFTGAHEDYHRPTDDVEKIDADGLVRVATFVRETIVYLADREAPLTSALGEGAETPKPQAGRRASLGTMPDFGFAGPGVKVASVLADSPAAQAGVAEGDVLLAIGGTELKDLRAMSDALKRHEPGDTVKIRLRRGDEELTLEATLAER